MPNRRDFIKGAAAVSLLSMFPDALKASANRPELSPSGIRIFPKRLKKGGTIGLITPGSPITKEQLESTVKTLTKLGFKPFYYNSVLDRYGYFAGKDSDRAAELNKMFANRQVDAVLCVRGGYGSIRILDKIDYNLIKDNPKIFVGYSDITALITSIHQNTGLITFHGPLGVSPFNRFTLDSFEQILMYPHPKYKYPYLREPETDNNPEFDLYTIHHGKAKGELTGGNISVLDSMIGSAFEPDFENKIVYLEEIEEKTYRVDKMLYHLLYATNLKKAAGIILGVFKACNVNDEPRLTLKQAIHDLMHPLNIPISYGFPFGHINNIITLPTGVKAKFHAGKNKLTLLEAAVS